MVVVAVAVGDDGPAKEEPVGVVVALVPPPFPLTNLAKLDVIKAEGKKDRLR